MISFNENLDSFLTACRENAIEELNSNGEYAKWKLTQADLLAELEALISPEARTVLENYAEAVTAVQGMEYNKILLCGLTVSAEMQKRFDASTPEYKAFAGKYL